MSTCFNRKAYFILRGKHFIEQLFEQGRESFFDEVIFDGFQQLLAQNPLNLQRVQIVQDVVDQSDRRLVKQLETTNLRFEEASIVNMSIIAF